MLIRIRPVPLVLSVAAAAGLLVASGLWAGSLTRRWGTTAAYDAARNRITSFPATLGPWKMVGDHPLSEKAAGMLQCGDAVFDRDYERTDTHQRLRVTLMAGPYGPLSVHKPSVCYPNLGLLPVRPPERKTIDSGGVGHDFWSAQFKSNDAGSVIHQVYYAWSTGGPFRAPDTPRFTFGGAPVLYKFQLDAGLVVEEQAPKTTDTPQKPETPEVVTSFLQQFLPVWDAHVLSTPTTE